MPTTSGLCLQRMRCISLHLGGMIWRRLQMLSRSTHWIFRLNPVQIIKGVLKIKVTLEKASALNSQGLLADVKPSNGSSVQMISNRNSPG